MEQLCIRTRCSTKSKLLVGPSSMSRERFLATQLIPVHIQHPPNEKLQRYMKNWWRGFTFMFSLGFLTIGWFIDLFLIPSYYFKEIKAAVTSFQSPSPSPSTTRRITAYPCQSPYASLPANQNPQNQQNTICHKLTNKQALLAPTRGDECATFACRSLFAV